jgi:hypothetical protein
MPKKELTVKLLAITIASLAFYQIAIISKPSTGNWNGVKRFLNDGCSLTFLALFVVVDSNIITLVNVCRRCQ